MNDNEVCQINANQKILMLVILLLMFCTLDLMATKLVLRLIYIPECYVLVLYTVKTSQKSYLFYYIDFSLIDFDNLRLTHCTLQQVINIHYVLISVHDLMILALPIDIIHKQCRLRYSVGNSIKLLIYKLHVILPLLKVTNKFI